MDLKPPTSTLPSYTHLTQTELWVPWWYHITFLVHHSTKTKGFRKRNPWPYIPPQPSNSQIFTVHFMFLFGSVPSVPCANVEWGGGVIDLNHGYQSGDHRDIFPLLFRNSVLVCLYFALIGLDMFLWSIISSRALCDASEVWDSVKWLAVSQQN